MIQFRMSADTIDRILASRRRHIEQIFPDEKIWYVYECLEYTEFSAYDDPEFGFMRLWNDGHMSGR